jgi:hypothetical protein
MASGLICSKWAPEHHPTGNGAIPWQQQQQLANQYAHPHPNCPWTHPDKGGTTMGPQEIMADTRQPNNFTAVSSFPPPFLQ